MNLTGRYYQIVFTSERIFTDFYLLIHTKTALHITFSQAANPRSGFMRRRVCAGVAAWRVICCRGRASILWFLPYVEYVSGRSHHALFCTDFE